MRLLPIGSIITLKSDEEKNKLMIICRFPFYKEDGYFDYAACVYPYGMIQDDFYYINNEDIDNVVFKGYSDEFDKKLIETLSRGLKDQKYHRLSNKPYSSDTEDLSDLLND